MDNHKYLKDIRLNLETYLAHINRLLRNPDKIHPLDVDLLKDKTKDIYETLYRIESETAAEDRETIPDVIPESVAEIEEVIEVRDETDAEEPAEIEAESISESVEFSEPAVEVEVPEYAAQESEIELTADETIPVMKEQVHIVEEESPIPDKETEVTEKIEVESEDKPSIVSAIDLFSSSTETTVADKFEGADDTTIATRIQKSTIQDIRQAIGINEKFLYVNELFNGDLGKYNKAIDEFNTLTTRQGVDTHLLELKVQNQWADENEAFVKFKSLLDRKNN